MSTILDCPSCTRKLRVSDDLLGQRVKCPTCGGTFDAAFSNHAAGAAPASPPFQESFPAPSPPQREEPFPKVPPLPLPEASFPPPPPLPPATPSPDPQPTITVPIKLSIDEFDKPGRPAGMAPPAPPRSDTDQSLPPRRSGERRSDFRRCPFCDERINADSRRCRYCGEDIDEENEFDLQRRFGVRRDCEPHRGTLILVLGVVSIVIHILGVPLGLPAWIMGARDIKKMDRGDMDPSGRGTTQAGYICGIIGTLLGALTVLGCVAYFAFIFIVIAAAPKTAPPVRTGPGQQQFQQPQNNPPPGGGF
jgi:predicted Zn finger-like uncharacterized protein